MKMFLTVFTLLVSSSMALANTAGNANTPAPTDAEIVSIVKTLNDSEVAAAQHALATSKNEKVKEFANHMVMDHKMNNEKAQALVSKLKIEPKENAKSNALKSESELSMKNLKPLKGADFDKAYINDQLSAHEKALKDLNNTLIPAAKNPELKAMLKETAPKIQMHVEHARKLQSSMM